MYNLLSELAFLWGQPTAKAKIKQRPEHFKVIEDLGFEFSGSGEHLMIRIRKTGENTRFVANELAKYCGVKSVNVSWAGLKDRHAITEQWLSVHLPGGNIPDFSAFMAQHPQIEILHATRHNKKLRPGDLSGNDFEITLTEVTDVEDIITRLEKIKHGGVPNYFGAQRFGNDGNNLKEARRWGRDNVRTRNQTQRSLYLSTARSWIFNQIVSARINQGCFDQFISGDIALMEGGESHVVTTETLSAWNQKLQFGQVAISAAMAGDNALPTQAEALALEQPFLDAEPDLMALIRGNRMRHDRRGIALLPEQLNWTVDRSNVIITFSLHAGCFATSILRELVDEIPVEREFDS